MQKLVFPVLASIVLLLTGCAGDRHKEAGKRDGPASRQVRAADVRDAVPKAEPPARYGNHSPYTVRGKTYTVLSSSKGYRERGIASWYGSKFHGRRTSSGELYDMYLATAAHKSLPLPTYAKVTNLDNGKKIIVKINDRGPFHAGRIIDLSYAAAVKLGVDKTGTARVEVRAIEVNKHGRSATKTAAGRYLQVGAFKQRKTAKVLAKKLQAAKLKPARVKKRHGLYKVLLGPYSSSTKMEADRRRAVELGYERPHTVKR